MRRCDKDQQTSCKSPAPHPRSQGSCWNLKTIRHAVPWLQRYSVSGVWRVLRRSGELVVLVTSGAIARGMRLMELPVRPSAMDELQAASAVGQGKLYRTYDELTKRVPAGQVIRELAPIIGGRGGGKPDMAEGGGNQPEKLSEALQASYGVIERMLG